MRDRGRERSRSLTAVRTILSRAETALEELEHAKKYETDEDYEEMRAALENVVESLEWWRRTGRPRKT